VVEECAVCTKKFWSPSELHLDDSACAKLYHKAVRQNSGTFYKEV